MPKRTDIESILVIGSGPIVIGQACEFDYSGTQACRVLKAEGYKVILANSNPATIMTDPDFAHRTYVEPLDVKVLQAIIEKERPDAILPTLGGQTALNLAIQLGEAGALAPCSARPDRCVDRRDPDRREPRIVQGGDDRDRSRRSCVWFRLRTRTRRCASARRSDTRSSFDRRSSWAARAPASRQMKKSYAGWPWRVSTHRRSARSSSSDRSRVGRSTSSR